MRGLHTGMLAALLLVAGFGQAIGQEAPFFLPSYGQSRAAIVPPASCDERLRPPLIQIGVAVLQDIKDLEQRPATMPDDWVEAVRQQYRRCIDPTGRFSYQIGDRDRTYSPDEQAVRNGQVERRLVRLALTGRISQAECDSLATRLQGNY